MPEETERCCGCGDEYSPLNLWGLCTYCAREEGIDYYDAGREVEAETAGQVPSDADW